MKQWFSAVLAKGVRISGPILKSKAEDLARKLGKPDFIATDGWLSRWKARHQIKFKSAHGEKNSADVEGAQEWQSTTLPQLLLEYRPDDIYNADETGLYYRATPDGSLCYTYEQLSGSKEAMDRVTVLCCANMTGRDKAKLLVIGKSKKPRCFKHVDVNTLPVIYLENHNAWMTSVLFQEWITAWDAALAKDRRKILLLVDNCTAHPHIDTQKNIRLEFLPANTTSLIQPMDQGVIKNLKTFYRKELVQMTVAAIEDNLASSSSTATDISSKVTLLDAIRFVAKSWRQVKADTIANCFQKGGFRDVTTSEEPSGSEEPFISEADDKPALPEVINGDNYLHVDDDVPCFTEDDYLEDYIVEAVSSKRPRQEDSCECEEEDDPDPVPLVSHSEAKHSMQLLQRYFVEQGFSEEHHAALDMCAGEVFRQAASNTRQSTLDRFI